MTAAGESDSTFARWVCYCSRAFWVRLYQRFPNFFSCAPPSTSQPGWCTPNPHFKKKENKTQQSFVLSPYNDSCLIKYSANIAKGAFYLNCHVSCAGDDGEKTASDSCLLEPHCTPRTEASGNLYRRSK